ncbi:MAG: TonB family protein [Xanthomonadaceae bacterium]|nr:TonB family protein [Xanthomonadaceae bacterium]
MSTVRPAAPPSPPASRWTLPKQVWWIIAAGFGLGLLLFVAIWLEQRNDGDFYRPERAADGPVGQVFEPLPTPQTGDDARSASGLSEAAEEALRNPRPAPPPVQTPRPAAAERPVANANAQNDRPRPVSRPASVPTPISQPKPSYPREALRNNETGTVYLRVTVDETGEPIDVVVSRSSRSRSLDRAASQAVKRWKFRPAQRDGQAVTATVDVPIAFSLGDDAR